MAVTPATFPSAQVTPWAFQNQCLAPIYFGDSKLSGKVYHRITSADLKVQEKSFAWVIGERVIAPAIQSIKTFSASFLSEERRPIGVFITKKWIDPHQGTIARPSGEDCSHAYRPEIPARIPPFFEAP